jgi:hypothetical protein
MRRESAWPKRRPKSDCAFIAASCRGSYDRQWGRKVDESKVIQTAWEETGTAKTKKRKRRMKKSGSGIEPFACLSIKVRNSQSL